MQTVQAFFSAGYFWLAVFVAGVAVSVTVPLALALQKVGSQSLENLTRFMKKQRKASGLSESLQQWVEKANKSMRVSFLQRRSVVQVLIMFLLSFLGLAVGTVILRNLPAGIILALGGFIVPEQLFHIVEQQRREKLVEQMGALVRMFSAEFSETPHVVKALGITAQKMPPPAGDVLKKAYKNFISGLPQDEVLIQMGRDMDNEYGRMFVQLLRLATEDEAVKPLFARLAMRLTAQYELIHKNRIEMSYDRLVSLIMNLAIIPAFVLVTRWMPEAWEFFTVTFAGRLIVCIGAASMVGGSFLDRIASQSVE